MSDISVEQRLANLELPTGDRFLIEHGILSEDGKSLTDAGKRVVLQYAYKAAKQNIIDDLAKAIETKSQSTDTTTPQ